jgi:hypothetical protein
MDEKKKRRFILNECDCHIVGYEDEMPTIEKCGLHEFAAEAAHLLNLALRKARECEEKQSFFYHIIPAKELEEFLDNHGLLEQDNKEAPSPR